MDQTTETINFDKQKKKSLRNTLFSTVALIFVTILIFSAQSYAYFTSKSENQENRIASGKLDIMLIEMQSTGAGETAYVNPVAVMAATDVSKIVKVQNTGSIPVYVRIKIEKSINKPENELPSGWRDLISCNFHLDDESTDNVLEGLWIYRDGYYYYSMPLDSDEATVPLFDTVSFSSAMGNEFQNTRFSMKVICQATQASGNYGSPLDAVGWPPEESDETTESVSGDTTESVSDETTESVSDESTESVSDESTESVSDETTESTAPDTTT